MSIFKRDLLFKMLEEEKIKSFTILGVPKADLINAFLKGEDLMKFLKLKGIQCNFTDNFEGTDSAIYFPQVGDKQYIDVCSITVFRVVDKQELNNILDLFDEVLGYYQCSISAKIINKILGLYENETLSFSDILFLIKENQSDIARKVGVSRQLISDVKYERNMLSLATLQSFMKEYPLLPWDEFILSI